MTNDSKIKTRLEINPRMVYEREHSSDLIKPTEVLPENLAAAFYLSQNGHYNINVGREPLKYSKLKVPGNVFGTQLFFADPPRFYGGLEFCVQAALSLLSGSGGVAIMIVDYNVGRPNYVDALILDGKKQAREIKKQDRAGKKLEKQRELGYVCTKQGIVFNPMEQGDEVVKVSYDGKMYRLDSPNISIVAQGIEGVESVLPSVFRQLNGKFMFDLTAVPRSMEYTLLQGALTISYRASKPVV